MHGCGSASQFRSSWNAHGHGPGYLHLVAGISSLRSGRFYLAQPGSDRLWVSNLLVPFFTHTSAGTPVNADLLMKSLTLETNSIGLNPATTMNNPLVRLQEYNQSPWFDYIRHSLLTSGELKKMIEEDGLKGVTSNPAIFEKAIVGSSDYVEILPQIRERTQDPKAIYEALAIGDVRLAADIMWPVYEATKKRDGYVSLEVSPYLARDTHGTIEEARRLWKAVNKANVMIKVPATE